ncbi:MAG TPA: hypothetical protein VD866_13040 [Urbifossiella sp.]|nr:hypothetical protein [Urbifossiella sp.]
MNFTPTFTSQFLQGFAMLPGGAKTLILLFYRALEYVLAMYSLPLEVYLRFRWGTRALTLFQVCFLVSLPVSSLLLTGSSLLTLFLLGSAVLGVCHFVEARQWERRPGAPHRMSHLWGEPVVWVWVARQLARRGWVPGRLFSEMSVLRFFEPATGLVGVGLVFLPPTRPLGVLLLVSGTALFAKRHVLYSRILDARRDRRDAVVLGQMLSDEGNADRDGGTLGETFEVRLVVPLVRRAEPPPPPVPVPLAVARIVAPPDAAGRPRVECPACRSTVRCRSDSLARPMRCPKCKTAFVVDTVETVEG